MFLPETSLGIELGTTTYNFNREVSMKWQVFLGTSLYAEGRVQCDRTETLSTN